MDGTAKKGRSRDNSTAAAATVLPEELIAWEILLRLPAKDILRCRAVCRAWRRLTSAADFLVAHHQRQPSLPLVSLSGSWHGGYRVDAALDALDLWQRPTERQPVLRFKDYSHDCQFAVHASCDGLILLSFSTGCFFLCNPATRQWISLPQLNGAAVAGMYWHAASSEYRVLYWVKVKGTKIWSALEAVYYVLSIGSSAEPRCIGQPIDSPPIKLFFGSGLKCLIYSDELQFVFLHDCLHWIQQLWEKNDGILVFDTVRESFRLMRYPTGCQPCPDLLEMGGTLAVSCLSESSVKLFVLQDYETEAWSLKYQIELPLAEMSGSKVENPMFYGMVVSENGDALIHCYSSFELFHIDSQGKLLQKFHWDRMFSRATVFRFKESLVRHAFLERPGGRRA